MTEMRHCRGHHHRGSTLASAGLFVILGAIGCSGTTRPGGNSGGIWEDPVNMNLFDSSAGTWLAAIIDALLPP